MRIAIFCLLILLCAGCGPVRNGNSKAGERGQGLAVAKLVTDLDESQSESLEVDSALHRRLPWADGLVEKYIRQSDNELIRVAKKSGYEVSWLWDALVVADSARFITFHLGHSYENNFVTDGWLYIDTTTRNIYEYDVTDESLKRWVQ